MFWSKWKYSPPKRVFQMLALHLGEADCLEPATPKLPPCEFQRAQGHRWVKGRANIPEASPQLQHLGMRCESNHHPSDKDHSRHALASEDTPANEVEASQVAWSQTQKKLIWLWFLFYSHLLIVWLGKKVYKILVIPAGRFFWQRRKSWKSI